MCVVDKFVPSTVEELKAIVILKALSVNCLLLCGSSVLYCPKNCGHNIVHKLYVFRRIYQNLV